jgi:hypothetical protein
MKARAAMRIDHHRAHVEAAPFAAPSRELLTDQRTKAGRFSLRTMVIENRMTLIPLKGMPA